MPVDLIGIDAHAIPPLPKNGGGYGNNLFYFFGCALGGTPKFFSGASRPNVLGPPNFSNLVPPLLTVVCPKDQSLAPYYS